MLRCVLRGGLRVAQRAAPSSELRAALHAARSGVMRAALCGA